MKILTVQFQLGEELLTERSEGALFRWSVGLKGQLNVFEYTETGEFVWTRTYRRWQSVESSA